MNAKTVNVAKAMTGLSIHTPRCYRRWITTYLAESTHVKRSAFNFAALNVALLESVLTTAQLKSWIGTLKAKDLGKQSLSQAKAALVFLAQTMADEDRLDYSIAHGLSRVRLPRAEPGQNPATWLTPDQVGQLLTAERPLKRQPGSIPVIRARNHAILLPLAVCGLRRDEVLTVTLDDLDFQAGNHMLRDHGKGEKRRVGKLPDVVVTALDEWHSYYPYAQGPIFCQVTQPGRVTAKALGDHTIWKVVREAAKLAGLRTVSPHDLRRSFARNAYPAGASDALIRQTLGHSNLVTTERYVSAGLELDHSATDIAAEAVKSGGAK